MISVINKTNDRLGQRIVIRVTRGTHRTLDAGLCKALGVADLQVMAAPDAMMH